VLETRYALFDYVVKMIEVEGWVSKKSKVCVVRGLAETLSLRRIVELKL
jgi:hypothetical protein